jgi:pathogenicity locus Cdd1 protein
LLALPSSQPRRKGTARAAESRRAFEPPRERTLRDLWSVGPAIQHDLESLGVHTVAQLARRSPKRLYRDLCRATGRRQDPCVLDTFRAAVAQARDPNLPVERCVWWYWSRLRKAIG